ncbi:hypothetical protein JZ751_021604 [Albula glossodonta]|uniref:Uncharacterized protein n=1 Tax=Albula glossodonta TaxID=121402 RepID=A0A8T2MTE5_9TELE|nr:hypothetical protein JZ751_021604 [Albula glossodonta]
MREEAEEEEEEEEEKTATGFAKNQFKVKKSCLLCTAAKTAGHGISRPASWLAGQTLMSGALEEEKYPWGVWELDSAS